MKISAALVKELREQTGAGMMDCKNALSETNGDIKKATELLKEKGLSKAGNKAGRVAGEGVIHVVNVDNVVSMIELNSESDFVSKNENFLKLANDISNIIAKNKIKALEELEKIKVEALSFADFIKKNIATIGENIVLRRLHVSHEGEEAELSASYLHNNKRVGVIIKARSNDASRIEKQRELLKQICMHAAAMKPKYLSPDELSDEYIKIEKTALIAELNKDNEELKRLNKPLKKIPEYVSSKELTPNVLDNEKSKARERLKAEGKPDKIIDEKILPGVMDRFIKDSTLLDQRDTLLGQFFVMDEGKSIDEVCKEAGINITEYVRYELGEGIEKKGEDFAAEVKKQLEN